MGLNRRTPSTHRGDPSARRLQDLGIALCFAVLLGLTVSFGALVARGSVQIQQADVMVYYSAGRLVDQGHGGSLYSWPSLHAQEASVIHGLKVTEAGGAFLNPPFFAAFIAVPALLPYRVVYALWILFNLTLLCLSLYVLQRYARLSRRGSLLLWAGGLSFFPVFATVIQGQSSVLMLALLTLGFIAWRAQRHALAGSLLALALLKPVIVLPVLLYLLVSRQWRVLAAFVPAALALFLVPEAMFGWRVGVDYVGLLHDAAAWHATAGFTPATNHSFWSFTGLLGTPPRSSVAAVALCAIMCAGITVWAVRGACPDACFAGAVITGLLVSPHLLVHDLSIWLLPAVIALRVVSLYLLGPLLVFGYSLGFVSQPISQQSHVQLSVVAMVALALLLWQADNVLVSSRRRLVAPSRPATARTTGELRPLDQRSMPHPERPS